jgi:hypothetical protein
MCVARKIHLLHTKSISYVVLVVFMTAKVRSLWQLYYGISCMVFKLHAFAVHS